MALIDATPFLTALGAPASPFMALAVEAWAKQESGGHIIGNNPWNLHVGPPCPSNAPAGIPGILHSQRYAGPGGLIGNRYAGPGDRNVAVYATLADGVRASAQNLLRYNAYGYPKVVLTARRGDPIDFLDALAASAWSAGRYGTLNGGRNKLIDIYLSLGGLVPPHTPEADPVTTVTITPFPPRAFETAVPALRRFTATEELGAYVTGGAYGATVDADVTLEGKINSGNWRFLRLASGGSKGKFILAAQVTLADLPSETSLTALAVAEAIKAERARIVAAIGS